MKKISMIDAYFARIFLLVGFVPGLFAGLQYFIVTTPGNLGQLPENKP